MSRYRDDYGDDCKVYVGDLPKDVSEKEIERVFREFGSIRSVWVARNPPGFAFVMFEDERDADDAVRTLDGSVICGVRARVKHSNARPTRSRPVIRKPFDPGDRCFRCNRRGHYAYDCEKYTGGAPRRSHSRSRSRSPVRRRSYSRERSYSRSRSASRGRNNRSSSRSQSRNRRTRRSPSRSESRSK